MATRPHKHMYKKIALALSLCLLILWSVLGTGASLAWFADSSEDIRNIFHFGTLELSVSSRQADGSYAPIDGKTGIFDDKALYEPGYVQVVYLKVENTGSCDFSFNCAVNVTDFTPGINYFGIPFHLQEHLRFGLVSAPTEEALLAQLSGREAAKALATEPLSHYSTQPVTLKADKTCFMALIVYMPENVNNTANYRDVAPTVELGVIIKASQLEN